MRSGLLEWTISIMRKTVSINVYGEQIETYTNHCVTRARILNENGQRQLQDSAFRNQYSKTFEVYRFVDVNELDWISFQDKHYRILSIFEDKHQNKKVINTELVIDNED